MTTTLCELTDDDVENLLEFVYAKHGDQITLDSGDRLELIESVEFVEEYRWAYINMLVLQDIDTSRFYGFYYEVPSTEMQEGQDDWSYISPQLVLVDRVPTYTYKEIG